MLDHKETSDKLSSIFTKFIEGHVSQDKNEILALCVTLAKFRNRWVWLYGSAFLGDTEKEIPTSLRETLIKELSEVIADETDDKSHFTVEFYISGATPHTTQSIGIQEFKFPEGEQVLFKYRSGDALDEK